MEINNNAIVTGASSGIGYAIAQMLASKGYKVYGIGRSFEDKCDFEKIVCDLSDSKQLTDTIEKIRNEASIGVLVNCAGVGYYGLHEEIKPCNISELVRVNLEAPMVITNLLLKDIKANEGYIINISSVTANEVNTHGCAYGATKAGLTSFTHSLFAEVRKHNVKVVNIQPDMTDTKLYRNADFTCDDAAEAHLTPQEIADAVAYVLEQREGMLVTDIVLKPQKHRIAKKSR